MTDRRHYMTDAFTDLASHFVGDQLGRSDGGAAQPFSLYLAYSVPHWPSEPLARTRPMFVEHEDHGFVRDGRWKLVAKGVAPKGGYHPERWELYDMERDRTEVHDLASAEPERVARLAAQWKAWADRVGVFPKDDARGKRAR